jgi:hypothetical protein
MPRSLIPQVRIWRAAEHGPALVALGLAILIVAAWWPAVPATTGMALVALGATHATIVRFRGFSTVVVLHATIYVMLYALFCGAACHSMAVRTGSDALRVLDLVVSVWPMAAAVRWSLVATGRGPSAVGDQSGRG